MRIIIELTPSDICNLTFNYNYSVYSFITKLCNKKHDESIVGKFSFHLDFPTNSFRNNGSDVTIFKPIYLYISSCDDDFITDIGNNLKYNYKYNINNFKFEVTNIKLYKPKYDSNKYRLKLLSPALSIDKHNKCLKIEDAYYTQPLINNAKRKIGQDVNITITPLIKEFPYKKNFKKIKNNGEFTGYWYTLDISLESSEHMYILLESGIGSKNSLGFGFVQIVE